MGDEPGTFAYTAKLFKYAFVFAVGTVITFYMALTMWSVAYMRATPGVSVLSSSGRVFGSVVLLVGVMIMFLSAGAAVCRIRFETL